MTSGRRLLASLFSAALAACAADPALPAACPADGYPAGASRMDGCTPGIGWLAFAFTRQGSSTPALFIGRPDGSCTERLTTDDASADGPAFFPGGTRLAYASDRSGVSRLYVRDLLTGAESLLETAYAFSPPPAAPVQLTAATPAVSPDGTTIAFEGGWTDYPGWSDIFTIPVAGGPAARVTRSSASALPKWSADGSLLYFYRPGAGELLSAPPDGTSETAVTSGSAISSRFNLSSDGQALLYARRAATGAGLRPTELVSFDLATHAVRIISSANEADPASDDATGAVAVSRRSAAGGYDLFLLDAASGAVKRQLTSCPGQAFAAAASR